MLYPGISIYCTIKVCNKPRSQSPFRDHQLAFFTPGNMPSKALSLNWNYMMLKKNVRTKRKTHSSHAKISQYTSTFPPHNTPVLYLCRPSIAVHLTELKLCLCSCSLGKRKIANNISECLSRNISQ
jgi:hypothetical protein